MILPCATSRIRKTKRYATGTHLITREPTKISYSTIINEGKQNHTIQLKMEDSPDANVTHTHNNGQHIVCKSRPTTQKETSLNEQCASQTNATGKCTQWERYNRKQPLPPWTRWHLQPSSLLCNNNHIRNQIPHRKTIHVHKWTATRKRNLANATPGIQNILTLTCHKQRQNTDSW